MKFSSVLVSTSAIIAQASSPDERNLMSNSATRFETSLKKFNRCCMPDSRTCRQAVLNRCPAIAERSSIAGLAKSMDDISMLVDLLSRADLMETLSMNSADRMGYTVFAPTNAAFEMLGDVTFTDDQMKEVLLYHVVAGTVVSNQLQAEQMVPTLNGMDLSIMMNSNRVTLNDGIMVTCADKMASNGVVHIIDMVLVPDMMMLGL